MKISIDGIDELIKQLKTHEKNLDDKKREFLTKLAQIGINYADIGFKDAIYDGVNDVVVSPEPEWVNDNTLRITATGKTVLFIEFGTGISYKQQHPEAEEHGMIRGSYGQGKGKRMAWAYYGKPGTNGIYKGTNSKGALILTSGNPPARAMYDAGKEMREQISKIAREVFGDD